MDSLVLFIPAIIAVVLVFRQARRVKQEQRRVKSGGGYAPPGLDPYSLAFLAGGPRRVVNTAVAGAGLPGPGADLPRRRR